MKMALIVIAGLSVLTGCVTDGTTDDRWAVRRHIDTPAGQAEMARLKAEAEERSARAAAQPDERRQREARISACQERNMKRKHSAQLYLKDKYEFEVCS